MYSKIEKSTKEVYLKQHKNYLKDNSIFKRPLKSAIDLKTYDLPASFFKKIHVLDAGCGNTGYFQLAMYRLGAGHVTCMDIGKKWIPELKRVMKKYKIPKNFTSFIDGSTTRIPAKDKSFDFVCSNGVLMHLNSMESAGKAIKELVRVCKPGGAVYAHIGIDKPGIVDRYIVKSIRSAYKADKKFKHFIDTLRPEKLNRDLYRIMKKSARFDKKLNKINLKFLNNLFTLDTITFWQNMIQVPVQQGPALGEKWGRHQFKQYGLNNIRRPLGIYWRRNDFRRFLSPIHFNLESPLAQLFYGNGHVKLIGEKPRNKANSK